MRTSARIIRYLLLALIVIILGALSGWYLFVHKNIKDTQATDSARGFGQDGVFGSTNGSTYENIVSGFTGSTTPASASGVAPRLWNVTKAPVAGFGFAATSTQLYFAERSGGNILEADPATSAIVRRTNTLFPKVYRALFAPDGSVLLRSISGSGTITTFAGIIATSSEATSSAPTALTGLYLPQNISALSLRLPRSLVYFVADPAAGGVVGVTADWKGAGQKTVFTSILSGWQVIALADGRMIAAQNASDGVMGYAYEIQGGGLGNLLAKAPGLVILPKSGAKALLYSTSQGGAVSLYAQASASAQPARLPIQTAADKCVWLPGQSLIAYCAVPEQPVAGAYLADRDQGLVHTADSWWQIDAQAGTAQEIYTPDSLALDAESPVIDASGNYIAFTNAADQSLWMLRINN